jgi:transposase
MLPHDLPPWRLVWHYFAHWKKHDVWAKLNDALRDAVRLQQGKKKPRPLRFSTRRVCAQLSKAEFAATMLARKWSEESDTSWSIRWG